MKPALSDNMLDEVSRYIAERMGLYFPRSKWRSLEQALGTAAMELGFKDTKECVDWFISSPTSKELVESLASYLTIGETYFLRENRCFEILEQKIIPEMLHSRKDHERRLRIWSAGCATGEEPYTIAIMLHRMRDSLKGYEISIMGTDINPHALRKAMDGVYSEWSFRTAPPWLKEKYFRQTEDKRYELLPHIRKMVSFSYFNLVEDLYPSLLSDTNALDVIFCRNVLMYFTPELAKKVIEHFNLCLLDGGWLLVSPCEASNPIFTSFAPVSFPDATLYRKQDLGARNQVNPGLGTWELELVKPKPFIRPASPVPSPVFKAPSPRSPVPDTTPLVPDPQAFANLCRIRANEGKLGEALQLSEQAISADKLNAGLYYLRAVILQEQGQLDEAAISLKRALYLDQDLVLAHFTLANLALRKGNEKESRKHLDNALTLLGRYCPEELLPESEGITAGRLTEIIRTTTVMT